MDILIFSVSAGGGHAKAARTIKNYYKKNYPEISVEIVDWLKYINPMIDKVVIGSYLRTVKTIPVLYKKLYDIAEKEDVIIDISRTITRPMELIMKRLINKHNPRIVLCTHPFPLEVICYLKERNKFNNKIVSLFTDYAPHSFWIRNGVDYYLIPNKDFVCDMVCRGVDYNKIRDFGIPIEESFIQPYNQKYIRDSLGLSNKTTIMLMGGSLGMGEIKNVFYNLMNSMLDIQLIAVCGNNKKLKKNLESIAYGSPKPNIIFGYTNKIPKLMAASDLLITKPGGLTISETISMQLPLAIISPIPGQEEQNAHYLMNNGMAVHIRKKDNIEIILQQLLNTPIRLQHMKEIAKLKGHPNSTENICEFLTTLLD